MGSGEAREPRTPTITLSAGVAAGHSVTLEKQVIYTPFNVTFCIVCVVLFFEEALPCFLEGKRP